ncbi:unnamed protein product [Choristocarpus tenellus]
MLPVFRLPDVGLSPRGGFLRRLPREESERERNTRLREEEELSRMKLALGLTSDQLVELESNLFQRGNICSLTLFSNCGGDNDPGNGVVLDLDKGPYEALSHHSAGTTGHGSSPDKGTTERIELGRSERYHSAYIEQHKTSKTERECGSKRYHSAFIEQHRASKADVEIGGLVLDRPTPRVLRHSRCSGINLQLGLGASATLNSTFGEITTLGKTWRNPLSCVDQSGRTGRQQKLTTEQTMLLATGASIGNIHALRQELGRSVGQVCSLSTAVKEDVLVVARACPVRQPRAQRFLQVWACERLAALVDEVMLSRRGGALDRWRETVCAMVRAERTEAYLRYQGVVKMVYVLDRSLLRHLAIAWVTWNKLVTRARALERQRLEEATAVELQRALRGYSARRLRRQLAEQVWVEQREQAATTITKHARGKIVRIQIGRQLADAARLRAAIALGRVARGMLGRRMAQRRRMERARLQMAIGLQRLFRGIEGRRVFLAVRKSNIERLAAIRIQVTIRGKWGREEAER